jgi:putative aldouronate transport system substrate-binding protein
MKVRTMTRGMTLLSFLFVLVLSQFIAACGGSSSTNGVTDLTLWAYPAATEVSSPPNDWFLIKTVREKLNINLKVTLMPSGDEGDTKMSAAAAANNLADVFQIPTNNNLFLQWVKLGLISPVDSLYDQMPTRTKDQYSDPTMKKLSTINGKIYALQQSTTFNKRAGLFIRQDWLDKLHLKTPKTLDDFLAVAKAFTTEDPDGNGKNDTYGFGATTSSSEASLGSSFRVFFGAYGLPGLWNYNTPGKVSLSLRDPGYLNGLEFVKGLADSKVIDPDWINMSTNDFRARWKQGKYGIMPEDFCAGMCQANYQSFDTNYPNGVWTPLEPPQGPDGTSYLGTYSNVGFRMAVSQKAMSAGKGAAIAKLLEWMDTDGYYLTAFGQEGTHYKLDAQGNVTGAGVPVPFYSHEAAPLNQLRNIAYKNTESELKARYPAFKTKSGRTMDPIEIYQTFAKMKWQDQTSANAIQPASNQNDVNRYVDEGLIQFVTGQKPLNAENWAAFLQGLDGLNVSDWETAANKTLKDNGLL